MKSLVPEATVEGVALRAAVKADCAEIARLYSISSEGVSNYIWSRLAAPGEDLLDVGRRRYEREGTAFSYQNCTVAVLADKIIGKMVAFPMHVDPADIESDPVLRPYRKLELDNSYYVCGVALYPQYRGRGIGSRFMTLAAEQAAARAYHQLSLIVFEKNSGARRLYERLGYREIDREPVYPHPLIHIDGDAILMSREIGP